jgi:NodT family efflux transporter outer membrane factor (OMF) lipoprotein
MLDILIQRAAKGNLSLQEAFARIKESRASLRIARSERFPNLEDGGYFKRTRRSEDFGTASIESGSTDNFYGNVWESSWEVDIWGRITRNIQSANADVQATVENYRNVLIILYAEVASSYIDVRTFQQRIKYAEANAEAQRKTLQLTRDRFKAEMAPELDVRQAELNLARTESAIPALEALLTQTINRLGVLLGEYPSALHDELAQSKPIPGSQALIDVGVPAELLRQRPDIRRSERRLAAQTARIGVATADLLPRFQLNGMFGFEGTKDFIDYSRSTWAFSPNFRWKLFEGGALTGQINKERALTEQALANYRLTVLAAFEDVENALAEYENEWKRKGILLKSVLAAEKSVDLVETLYKTGLTNFQNVQDMQRSLFVQQDEFARSEGMVSKYLVRLYKALGGGWSTEDGNQYKKGILDKTKKALKLPTGVL